MDIISTISLESTIEEFSVQVDICLNNNIKFFRYNLAKINIDKEYLNIIKKLHILNKRCNEAQIIFDLPYPGMKPRVFLKDSVVSVKKGERIKFYNKIVSKNMINVDDITGYFIVGEECYYKDGEGILKVVEVSSNFVVYEALNDFEMISGKSLSSGRVLSANLKFSIFNLINEVKPSQIWFSFVENMDWFNDFIQRIFYLPKFYLKVETKDGVRNIGGILKYFNVGIVVARGDLGLAYRYNLYKVQNDLIYIAKKSNCKVYIATDFLKTMQHQYLPSRSEMTDLQSVIYKGCDGIMLNGINLNKNFTYLVNYINECQAKLKSVSPINS